MQACRSILRWAAWPMIQAAASAYFASHVAGLQGQLLEVMIGADTTSRDTFESKEMVWRRCAKPNTTARRCALAVLGQSELTATMSVHRC